MDMCINEISHLVKVGIDSVAQTYVGQKLLSFGDRVLAVIDDCLQWSLPTPTKSEEKNGEPFTKTELKRPLPWVLFLPTLLFLRFVRFSINMGTKMLGFKPFEPQQMIHTIQSLRHRLNVSRIRAHMQNKKKASNDLTQENNQSFIEASKGLTNLANSLCLTLSTLACMERPPKGSSPPPTQIRVTSVYDDDISLEEYPKMTNEESGEQKERKRKSEDMESSSDEEQDETILNQINRLADVPSDEDSDYIPSETEIAVEEEDEVDYKDKDEGENSLEEDISDDEVAEVVEECNEFVGTQIDSKLCKIEILPMNNKLILQEKLQSACIPSTNGGGVEEHEDAYYSPTSWKSVSPEISMPHDKHVDFIEHEKKVSTELSNGEAVNNDKVEKDDDSPSSSSTGGETVKDVAGNGHVKDKRHTTSHSGKHHHHHHKNKRNNHAGRKKK